MLKDFVVNRVILEIAWIYLGVILEVAKGNEHSGWYEIEGSEENIYT